MKKHVILILFLILSVSIIQRITDPLSILQNIFLIEENLSNYDEFSLFKEYKNVNNNILQSTMYKTNTGFITNSLGSRIDVRYYEVDGNINDFLNLKVTRGRFIWPEDYENKVKYIVIDEKTAVKFFLNTNCTGEKIQLNNVEYTICGVYKEDNSLLGNLSRTYRDDSSLVFIPIQKPAQPIDQNDSNLNQDTFGIYTILFKIKPGYGFILNKGMENYFSQNMGKEIILKNLDYEVKSNIQKVKALKFIIFLIVAIYILTLIYRDLKEILIKIKNDLKRNYLFKAIMNNKFFLIKKMLVYSLFIILAIYFYNKLKFQVVIDPDIIPSKLIDLNEIQTKFINYIVKMNTIPNYATKFEAMLKNGGNIINYLGIFIFIIFLFYFDLLTKNRVKIFEFIKNVIKKIIDVEDLKSLFAKTPKVRRRKHG
ncbi:MAG: ABC transporter permease [Oscillospiraceae bacterium]|nr:ABC transporter permease [Oscillospiraceae bacterium]